MDNSLFRYWNETRDADGEPLTWPGGPGGFPYRGNPRTFTQEEFEKLPLSYKARVKLFHMNDEAELEEYRGITERVANGRFILKDRDRQWDDAAQCYRIYLEWLEPGYDTPASPGVLPAMPLPMEGLTYAVNGPDSQQSVQVQQGIPPGMQFESFRGGSQDYF